MTRLKDQRGVIDMILIGVMVVLLAAAGFLYYKKRHDQVAKPASAPMIPAAKPASQTPTVTIVKPNQNVVKIPELSIEITVPDSIKDLVYVAKTVQGDSFPSGPGADFSTATLTSKDQECSDTGSAPPLGGLTKTAGQYPTDPTIDNASGSLVKQFSGFYISYSSPQAICSENSATEALATQQKSAFTTALKTVTQLP